MKDDVSKTFHSGRSSEKQAFKVGENILSCKAFNALHSIAHW